MALRHAILGVLQTAPLHGYAIADELERRIAGGRYNSAQIYQGLHWLADRHLVHSAEPQPGVGRDRRPFFITPRGRREFERWLRSPFVPSRPSRDDAIVKLVFLGTTTPEQLVPFLERLKRQHLRRLSTAKPASRKTSVHATEQLFAELSGVALRLREEAELRWIDHCLQRLASLSAEVPAGEAAPEAAARTRSARTEP